MTTDEHVGFESKLYIPCVLLELTVKRQPRKTIPVRMSTTQTAPKDKSIAQNPEHEGSWMPKPVLRFYAKFPLVVLPAEQAPSSIENRNIKEPVLWVSLQWHTQTRMLS